MNNYSKIDHYHCFTERKPPCGQRIKHFECCLCKELHPDITSLLSTERKKERELIRNRISNFLGSKYEGIERISEFHDKGIMSILSDDYDDAPKQNNHEN